VFSFGDQPNHDVAVRDQPDDLLPLDYRNHAGILAGHDLRRVADAVLLRNSLRIGSHHVADAPRPLTLIWFISLLGHASSFLKKGARRVLRRRSETRRSV